MPASTLKAVRADSVSDEPHVKHITLRGVQYTIREADLTEYDDCVEAATKDGAFTFGELLRQMVLLCVTPSIAAGRKPISFPVYRMLEKVVNDMHFVDIPEDKQADEPVEVTAPNE